MPKSECFSGSLKIWSLHLTKALSLPPWQIFVCARLSGWVIQKCPFVRNSVCSQLGEFGRNVGRVFAILFEVFF